MVVNMMEKFVESALNNMSSEINCCMCEICRGDILAMTLNTLPPKYVNASAGNAGELFTKLNAQLVQNSIDLRIAIMKSVEIVKAHPRHSNEAKIGIKDTEKQ